MDPAQEIFGKMHINAKKLAFCKLHEFTIDKTPKGVREKIWACVHCGGEVGNLERIWYHEGKDHANNKNEQKKGER